MSADHKIDILPIPIIIISFYGRRLHSIEDTLSQSRPTNQCIVQDNSAVPRTTEIGTTLSASPPIPPIPPIPLPSFYPTTPNAPNSTIINPYGWTTKSFLEGSPTSRFLGEEVDIMAPLMIDQFYVAPHSYLELPGVTPHQLFAQLGCTKHSGRSQMIESYDLTTICSD